MSQRRSAFVLAALLMLQAKTWAAPQADCFQEAARYHGVSAAVLRAIARVESNFQPQAVAHNRNGSTDIGMMQINSIHLDELARWGVQAAHLHQACISIYVAAWHYRRQVEHYGHTWLAVGAYHSRTPKYRDAYAARVRQALRDPRTLLASQPLDRPER
ncbi:lytic transglycosylase domain-containing protein [Comamonas composti]|uniref:lytic transglycosylase domain-containing protein n=1 Tax=Comamonas composti TaxID=408558 RepID=UPI0004042E71|nr:lytic transglycosylase domain-containing protein [Comamonas composti]